MNLSVLQFLAQSSVERLANALPEGILIAVSVWGLLRLLRRQSSGARFALWFIALLTVGALPGMDLLLAMLRHTGAASASSPATPSLLAIPGSWAVTIFSLWAAGATLALCRLAAGLWRLRQLRRDCTPVNVSSLDAPARDIIHAALGQKSVTLATSDSVHVPAAIGLFRPAIVLPSWALNELSTEDLKAVLLHELAHIERRDPWTNLIQKFIHAVFFFHPAVWWIESRLSIEREMACDDAVITKTSNPGGYAACLVSLLEKSLARRAGAERWSMAHAAVRRAREASLRLARILDSERPAVARAWKAAFAATLAFAVLSATTLVRAPRLVAFESSDTATLATASLPAPSYALRKTPDATPIGAKAARSRALVPQAVAAAQPAAIVEDDLPALPELGGRVVETSMPLAPLPTVVFVQATRYGFGPQQVWRIEVWRVTVFAVEQGRRAEVPVVNSI